MMELNDSNQARWDADTLAEAERIKNDPNRMKKAQAAANVRAEEIKKEADHYKKVGGKNPINPKPFPSAKSIPVNSTGVINVLGRISGK